MQNPRTAFALALATLSLSLGACAVDPDATDTVDEVDQAASALNVVGPGSIEVSPAMSCASTSPDATLSVGPSWQSSSGASVAGGTCDWRVVELPGVSARKVDVVVTSPPADPLVPQARCADSVMQDVVYGLVPAYWRSVNGGMLYVPARWEQVDSTTQHGFWTMGACHFTHYEQNSTLSASGHTVVVRAPYTAMRVATRARLGRADGTFVRGTLSTNVRTLPLLPGE